VRPVGVIPIEPVRDDVERVIAVLESLSRI
jgi:hypothetical protein